jgi:hypothetical protein
MFEPSAGSMHFEDCRADLNQPLERGVAVVTPPLSPIID